MESIRLYIEVPANDIKDDDYTPGDGVDVNITKFVASGIFCSSMVKIEFFWDTELIFVAHGSVVEEYIRGGNYRALRTVTGDGSKKLKVLLSNDTDSPETIGGSMYWE